MKEIINKKVNQLEGHVNNLNTLKKELEGESATVLNNTFSKDKEEYTKSTVNQMLKDYEKEKELMIQKRSLMKSRNNGGNIYEH